MLGSGKRCSIALPACNTMQHRFSGVDGTAQHSQRRQRKSPKAHSRPNCWAPLKAWHHSGCPRGRPMAASRKPANQILTSPKSIASADDMKKSRSKTSSAVEKERNKYNQRNETPTVRALQAHSVWSPAWLNGMPWHGSQQAHLTGSPLLHTTSHAPPAAAAHHQHLWHCAHRCAAPPGPCASHTAQPPTQTPIRKTLHSANASLTDALRLLACVLHVHPRLSPRTHLQHSAQCQCLPHRCASHTGCVLHVQPSLPY